MKTPSLLCSLEINFTQKPQIFAENISVYFFHFCVKKISKEERSIGEKNQFSIKEDNTVDYDIRWGYRQMCILPSKPSNFDLYILQIKHENEGVTKVK